MNAEITKSPFEVGQILAGRWYGEFEVCGSRWSEVWNQWVVEVRRVFPEGQRGEVQDILEGCFIAAGA
jgi:hypothetical protein